MAIRKTNRQNKDRGLNSSKNRVCYKCKKLKKIDEFTIDKLCKFGHSYICRECEKIFNRIRYLKYYSIHKEEILERRHQRYLNDKRSGVKKAQDKAIRCIKINTNICQICKKVSNNLERHHFDYSKPIDVIIVCRSCHRLIHSQLSNKNTHV